MSATDMVLAPFVGGEVTGAASDRELALVDPAQGRETARFLAAGQEAVDAAVAAARAAQPRWIAIPPVRRAGLLRDFAGLIERHREDIAAADRLDIGKPIAAAQFEVGIAAGFVRYYAEAIDKWSAGQVAPTDAGAFEVQLRRPRGVIAAIVPWNFPVVNACMKLAPMLAAGNAMVMKPSELSPRAALILARLAVEAGLPAGVFNVLPGDGATGDLLARHAGVDMIAFTGSTATGRALMRAVGESTLKPVLLECGGKSPEIVFGDMAEEDLDAMAAQILGGAMMNQGQLCVARTRLYVERPLYAALAQRLVAAARAMKAGDPDDPRTRFGPLASARQHAAVARFIEQGVAAGAELLLDGRQHAMSGDGCFIEPTIFAEPRQDQPLVQEEIFGPVLTLAPFDGEAEAIRLANGTRYGLAATVWTRDIGRAHRMAGAVEAGMVKIMAAPVRRMGAGFAHSAEPARQSGFGIEGGLGALDSFSRLQAVEFHYGDAR